MDRAVERHASRILLLDELDRALLFRYRADAPFWIVPGGGLEPGEDHLAAARRELVEETGRAIEVQRPVGRLVRLFRRRDGVLVRQHEVWFLARTSPFELDPAHVAALAAEGILGGRWFDREALTRCPDPLVPTRLAELVAAASTGGLLGDDLDLAALFGEPPAP